MINWDSQGAALSKHIQTRLHYSTLVHDILPPLAFLNKQDKGKQLCPCCGNPNETRNHILKCPAPSRNRWHQSFLTSLDLFVLQRIRLRNWDNYYKTSSEHGFLMATTQKTFRISCITQRGFDNVLYNRLRSGGNNYLTEGLAHNGVSFKMISYIVRTPNAPAQRPQ